MIQPDPGLQTMARAQFTQAYSAARRVMRADKSPVWKFVEIVKGRNRDGIDEMGRQVREMTPVGCKSGCSSCCHQEVLISSSDACWMALWLRTHNRQPHDLAKAAVAANVSQTERYANGIACPFLRNRECSIYEARPEPCRDHYSVSRPACLQSWAQRKKPTQALIPFIAEPKLFGGMIVAGSDCAMQEEGIQASLGELAAMTALACQPDAIERWLSGDAIFPVTATSERYTDGLHHLRGLVSSP